MTIFLFPTDVEARRFRELCPQAEVVISGVGLVETSATLMRLFSQRELRDDDMVVLCGIAGAYDDGIERGSVVEVTEECCEELPERFRKCYRIEPQTMLRGVRSSSVHRGGGCKTDAEIENMEGAALFAMCRAAGVRCAEIRAVSNIVGEEFSKWQIDLATERLAQQLKSIFFN